MLQNEQNHLFNVVILNITSIISKERKSAFLTSTVAHFVSCVPLGLPSRNDRDRVVAMQERRDVRTFLDGAETAKEGGRHRSG